MGVICSLIGAMDAIVLGGLCNCKGGVGQRSTRSSIADMSYVAPAREPSMYGRSASFFHRKGQERLVEELGEQRSDIEAPPVNTEAAVPQQELDDTTTSKNGRPTPPYLRRPSSSSVSIPKAPSFRTLFSSSTGNNNYDLGYRQRPAKLGPVRLFASTWNVGGVGASEMETDLPKVLPKWIPFDYDLYVRPVVTLNDHEHL